MTYKTILVELAEAIPWVNQPGQPPYAFRGARVGSRRRPDNKRVDGSFFEDFEIPFDWTLRLPDGVYKTLTRALVLKWEGRVCLHGMDLTVRLALEQLRKIKHADEFRDANAPSLKRHTWGGWTLRDVDTVSVGATYASSPSLGYVDFLVDLSKTADRAEALALICAFHAIGRPHFVGREE